MPTATPMRWKKEGVPPLGVRRRCSEHSHPPEPGWTVVRSHRWRRGGEHSSPDHRPTSWRQDSAGRGTSRRMALSLDEFKARTRGHCFVLPCSRPPCLSVLRPASLFRVQSLWTERALAKFAPLSALLPEERARCSARTEPGCPHLLAIAILLQLHLAADVLHQRPVIPPLPQPSLHHHRYLCFTGVKYRRSYHRLRTSWRSWETLRQGL